MRLFALIIVVANSGNIFNCAKEIGTLGRIVRGRDAVLGQFPYVAKLDIKADKLSIDCTGALIGVRWLLTAAHCVKDMKRAKVFLGSISKDSVVLIHDVATTDVTIHPDFRHNLLTNDIALIKIPRTRLNEKVGIVPLPKKTNSQPKYEDAFATACGWGLRSTKGTAAKKLQCGRLQILSANKCRQVTKGITKDEMCTAVSPNLANPCLGDSGAPLVLETTGELVGLVSNGDTTNCETGFSTVFTRVSSHLDWIKSVSGIYYS